MESPFAIALAGAALNDSLRDQYLPDVEAGYDVVLAGRMTRVWHRPRLMWFPLWVLSKFDIFFPETGTDIPCVLEIRTAPGPDGSATQTWTRTFHFPGGRRRRYRSTMAGVHGTAYVDELQGPGDRFEERARIGWVAPGVLEIETFESRVRFGRWRILLPRWMWPTARAVQRTSVDERGWSEVSLVLSHRLLGEIFGYEGRFRTFRRPVRSAPPSSVASTQAVVA